VGVGTTFKIYVPATSQPGSLITGPEVVVDTFGTETILLVEDEPDVRRLALLALTRCGYTVLEAADGTEAMRILEDRDGRVDLVVTDLIMPRMGGRALVEAAAARFAGIKVLYTSGYTDDAVIRHGLLQAELAFLLKPYTPIMLLRKIRDVLDRGPVDA
ncbi:MAG: response regulator, partial [Gemmatimonadota bacterium]